MFNSFHNYAATQLSRISESRRFTIPSGLDEAETVSVRITRDEDLFQTARLITCGLYMSIILRDYVRTILNLNRTKSNWVLAPRARASKTSFTTPVPHSTGNQVSMEFNLLYQWHSALSDRDAFYFQNKMGNLFQEKHRTTPSDITNSLASFHELYPEAPEQRTIDGLERQAAGYVSDDALVKELSSAIEDVAGDFGAKRFPKTYRAIEILAIDFEDINPDPEIAEGLTESYEHPDAVELYPGLVAEKTKPVMMPGSGLCSGFTTSHVILYDAVALVRGDRFYMDDWNPANVNCWVASDTDVDNGCVMYKLILGAFPKHFGNNSIYAHYHFVVPDENRKIMRGLGRKHDYFL
ncbi:heme peroxidase [Xylariales sp. AK1849]|nr:heme peroxidase [Xylariales sp. AK1849]